MAVDAAPVQFQSTLSMRRATTSASEQSPQVHISIHALHEESDSRTARIGLFLGQFQSTLSMRRATLCCSFQPIAAEISIHALHEESDPSVIPEDTVTLISIHAFHEESDAKDGARWPPILISIHALHEESDRADHWQQRRRGISIHALHEESDSAAGHFCPLFETQASCLALSISNNTADTTNNMSKTSNWLSVSF